MATQEMVPMAGQSVTQGFGTVQMTTAAETSAQALAAREKATIEALFIMADQRPRDIRKFEAQILAECERPGFAEVARYSRPVGKEKNKDTGEWEEKFAEGFSIRFAEACARYFRNLYIDSKIAFEDQTTRIVRNVVLDLESCVMISQEQHLSKRVERRGRKQKGASKDGAPKPDLPPDGREILGERKNSYGETVFSVVATDDELKNVQNSNFSKFMRNGILRFIPGDIQDACERAIARTLGEMDGKDLKQSIDKLVHAFAGMEVSEEDLVAFLGHSLAKITAKELQGLRKVYTAIREGHATWAECAEAKNATVADTQPRHDVLVKKIREMDAAGDHGAAERFAKDNNIPYPLRETPAASTGEGPTKPKPTTEGAATAKQETAADAPSALPVREFAEFPDAFEFPDGQRIRVKGAEYVANEDKTGWTAVKSAEQPQQQRGFGGFGGRR